MEKNWQVKLCELQAEHLSHCATERGLSLPERNTIVVHEIKDNWQERHYVAHLADLLTNADTEVRKRIARPVAQVLGYAVSPLGHSFLLPIHSRLMALTVHQSGVACLASLLCS